VRGCLGHITLTGYVAAITGKQKKPVQNDSYPQLLFPDLKNMMPFLM
jgi:hypothetical protein